MRNPDSWPAILLRAFAVHMVALLIFGLAFVGGNFLLAQMGSGIVFFRGLLGSDLRRGSCLCGARVAGRSALGCHRGGLCVAQRLRAGTGDG